MMASPAPNGPPPPAAMTTNCLPPASYVIGVARAPAGKSAFHSSRPVSVSNARIARSSVAPMKTTARGRNRTAEVYGAGKAAHGAERNVPGDRTGLETDCYQGAKRRRNARQARGTEDQTPAHDVGRAMHACVLEIGQAALRIRCAHAVAVEPLEAEQLHHRRQAIYRHDGERVAFIYGHAAPSGAADVPRHDQRPLQRGWGDR